VLRHDTHKLFHHPARGIHRWLTDFHGFAVSNSKGGIPLRREMRGALNRTAFDRRATQVACAKQTLVVSRCASLTAGQSDAISVT